MKNLKSFFCLLSFLLIAELLVAQNTNLLENQNGYRDFKFGMTSEQINALGILGIPPQSKQFLATEYQNPDVTYLAFWHLDQFVENPLKLVLRQFWW